MISEEESCDTEDLSTDWYKFSFNIIEVLKCNTIYQYYSFYSILIKQMQPFLA